MAPEVEPLNLSFHAFLNLARACPDSNLIQESGCEIKCGVVIRYTIETKVNFIFSFIEQQKTERVECCALLQLLLLKKVLTSNFLQTKFL